MPGRLITALVAAAGLALVPAQASAQLNLGGLGLTRRNRSGVVSRRVAGTR